MLITGRSGSGKTVAMKMIENAIADDGGIVLVLNFNNTHQPEEQSQDTYRINVLKEGLPFPLLCPIDRPDGSMEDFDDVVEEAVDIFSNTSRLQVKQKMALRNALQRVITKTGGHIESMDELGKELMSDDSEASQSTYVRLFSVFSKVKFSQGGTRIKAGRVTVLDFSGFSGKKQAFLAEMTLSILWRYFRIYGQFLDRQVHVACDEFQVLKLHDEAVVSQILREGRKFNLALILATQTLAVYDRGKRAVLQQAATQLYFHPTAGEVPQICSLLGWGKSDELRKKLTELKVGECIGCGCFTIGSKRFERPLKISFR